MIIREPVVAGRLYPAELEPCRAELLRLLSKAGSDFQGAGRLWGGLVPHDGWVSSGILAAKVFGALQASHTPDVLILIGGVHRHRGRQAALFGTGVWQTPLGPVEVDNRLAERILGHTNLIVDDPYAHEEEHSIEVQMPFVKHLFPGAKVVPLMVPANNSACEVGEAVGRTLTAYRYNAMVVGTTDLTHYGPGYGFAPLGTGANANAWAKELNDRRFIDLICALKGAEVVREATSRRNACSSGATAATLGAVTVLGGREGILLEHSSSSEVLGRSGPDTAHDSVGYAAIVFE